MNHDPGTTDLGKIETLLSLIADELYLARRDREVLDAEELASMEREFMVGRITEQRARTGLGNGMKGKAKS